MKHLSARLRRLEPKSPASASAPNVLEVEHGETVEDAFARFRSRWPNVRAGHRFMVVPATITPAEFSIRADARRAERQRAFEASNSEKEASL